MATESMKGKIGVTTENIFPVIKQFLYSDHEIFLRELVANAVDASQKMKALASSGDFKGELGDIKVSIELDENEKILRIIDRGIGMTEEEVDRYINQIAFSSAGEFLEKYKDQIGSIIGHFGLGFYSAFMVSKKVTIDTLSWVEGAKAVRWTCDGSPEYTIEPSDKTDRGTVISLYIDDDSVEFAQKARISQLLGKYCKFMPVPVVFGKKTKWEDGKSVKTDERFSSVSVPLNFKICRYWEPRFWQWKIVLSIMTKSCVSGLKFFFSPSTSTESSKKSCEPVFSEFVSVSSLFSAMSSFSILSVTFSFSSFFATERGVFPPKINSKSDLKSKSVK